MTSPMNFEKLVSLCQQTHQQLVAAANRTIDTHLVARNFLFGLYIVHFEQEGADRASYGKQTQSIVPSFEICGGTWFFLG